MEIPVIDGGKHYPVPFKKKLIKPKMYLNDMPDNVFSIGQMQVFIRRWL